MAVRIGHASIDENGKATGGIAGDQTGKEVKISSWYDGGWDFVARAKDPAVAEAIAAAAEAGCKNANIGYDQSGRNTLMTQAKAVDFDLAKIATPCETDCSAFVSVCVRAALGEDFYTGNAPTTSTLKKVLSGTGAFEILTDSKYLTSDQYLKRGDILNRTAKHVVMALDDGAMAVTAETAAEAETAEGNQIASGVTYTLTLPLLRKGDSGPVVEALQAVLVGKGYTLGTYGPNGDGVDGKFGNATQNAVEAFQEDNTNAEGKPLEVDGEVGGETWAALLGL